MVEVEGSAGGSILRIATGISTCLNIPIRITHIRKHRKNPGVQPQHLAGLEAIARVSGGIVKGAYIGSTEVEYIPGRNWKKEVAISIPTAGSISLALQPVLLSASCLPYPVKVEVSGGGTFGKWSPPLPYWQYVAFPLFRRFHYKVEAEILRHGFYPVGGGRVRVYLEPLTFMEALDFRERGEIRCFRVLSVVSEALRKRKVGERMVETATKQLERFSPIPIFSRMEYVEADSPGCGIVVWAECEKSILGADGIGELGKPAEKVASEATQILLEDLQTDSACDRFFSDQILPFLALFGGVIRVPQMTEHIRILLPVLEKLVSCRFSVSFPFISCKKER
ncbi:MAG: RNA 3'-terminal phosphate cyclase [bacterium JZ-2024 1]